MSRVRPRHALALAAAGALLACAGSSTPPPASPRSPAAPPRVLPGPEAQAAAPAHVILISIAGLPPRAYRSGEGQPAWMPNLAALARAGAAADGVIPVTPASAGPAHATLVTGRTPAGHGIGGEHPLGPQGIAAEGHREARSIRGPALWDATREAGLLTAAVGWPTSAGAPVDWLLPELIPVRPGETAMGLLEGSSTGALLAAAQALGADRPEAGFPGPVRDGILARLACDILGGEAPPRLLLLRLSQTEPVLQRTGPGSDAVAAAFGAVDVELGRVVACLAAAGRLAASTVLVIGDAPVAPVHTLVQPNVALEAAGLLVPAPGTRSGITRWEAAVRANGTSAFVHAREAEAALLARQALIEAAEQSRAFRIVSAEELTALGADREAWFGLEAAPGYLFGDGFRGSALVLPSPARGASGSLAGGSSRQLGFVAWGSGIRPELRIPELRQTDVAPTVARLLGIELPPGEGRALVGVLRPPPVAAGPPRGLPGAR